MRADRLVAILLMLQRRGSVTAAAVAAELEISERTARRDLDALCVAGLPVYSQRGRGGGWSLVGGGTTDLSGLSEPEVRALFMLAGPSASAAPELRAALRKLVRALPEPFQAHAEAASRSVIVDPLGWNADAAAGRRNVPPCLEIVQEAVVRGRVLSFEYTRRDRANSRRLAHPLGLACKGGLWYLVADTNNGLRTFRVDRIEAVEITTDVVSVPTGFDLRETWALISDEIRERRLPYRAKAAVRVERLGIVRYVFGDAISIGASALDGWVSVELRGESALVLASQVAGFGAWIDVERGQELANELRRIAAELTAAYASD